MNDLLLLILSIIGLLVIYWIIWGQRRYQRTFHGEHIKKIEEEIGKIEAEKAKAKPKKVSKKK